jgi:hypothetical protein
LTCLRVFPYPIWPTQSELHFFSPV